MDRDRPLLFAEDSFTSSDALDILSKASERNPGDEEIAVYRSRFRLVALLHMISYANFEGHISITDRKAEYRTVHRAANVLLDFLDRSLSLHTNIGRELCTEMGFSLTSPASDERLVLEGVEATLARGKPYKPPPNMPSDTELHAIAGAQAFLGEAVATVRAIAEAFETARLDIVPLPSDPIRKTKELKSNATTLVRLAEIFEDYAQGPISGGTYWARGSAKDQPAKEEPATPFEHFVVEFWRKLLPFLPDKTKTIEISFIRRRIQRLKA